MAMDQNEVDTALVKKVISGSIAEIQQIDLSGVNKATRGNMLQKSIAAENFEILEILLGDTEINESALEYALRLNKRSVVQFLLERNVTIRDDHFELICSKYCKNNRAWKVEMIKLLIIYDQHIRDHFAGIIEWAIFYKRHDIIEIIFKRGISKDEALTEMIYHQKHLTDAMRSNDLQNAISYLQQLPASPQPTPPQTAFNVKHPTAFLILTTIPDILFVAGIAKIIHTGYKIKTAQRLMANKNSLMNFRQDLTSQELSIFAVETRTTNQLSSKTINGEMKKLKSYLVQAKSGWKRRLFGITKKSITKAQQGIERLNILKELVNKKIKLT